MTGTATKKFDDRGLYLKFEVKRVDGQDAKGKKHEGCAYFVLDLNHDPFALAALKAYATACREKRPALASDIDFCLEDRVFGPASRARKLMRRG